MKQLTTKRIISFLLCFVFVFTTAFAVSPVASARSESEINKEIAKLEAQQKELKKEINAIKSKKAEQTSLKKKIEAQISNLQQQISLCNSKISQFNTEIAENEAKIKEKEKEKEETIFLFKQRLRTIHMSNGSSSLQVLLGAESFADYLALAKLTKAVSAHDQRIVERIILIVDEINAAQKEIAVKIEAQNEAKADLAEKKAELDKQVKAVNGVIAEINKEQNATQKEYNENQHDIEELEAELAPYIHVTTGAVYDGSAFTWPVPGHYNITSYYGKRWGKMHRGIDISDGRISGAPIVAIADGVVIKTYSGCKHNYASFCGCGGGWGNHVMIDHGSQGSTNYKSLNGHMTKTAVSVGQKVKKGQVIGYVGSTGNSTGAHDHFEIYVNGNRVNPLNYYRKVK
ncbi:MAG: peptidoglycan DD-metalloendopeptidase family protein [Acutalibacteraceae bacterium]|nr:peptidoglycan DD-metalloendopeptidase family protein [Acutalibacteraceae bacterium]